MKFTVYFEIFGKSMKATVEADSVDGAKYIVSGKVVRKIVFGDVVEEPKSGENAFDFLKNIVSGKG